MENSPFENFIWFGNYLLNLTQVSHFVVEENRVTVKLISKIEIPPIDGDEAVSVIDAINEVFLGRMVKAPVFAGVNYTIGAVDLNAAEDGSVEEGIMEIGHTQTRAPE